MFSMTYSCGRLSGPLQWLDQPCPTNQHLGQGQIRGLSHSALMYYILYFYVQPFYIQSSTFIISTFIVFYVPVPLHWDPFYIQSFYLQSSSFSLLRLVFLHSIPALTVHAPAMPHFGQLAFIFAVNVFQYSASSLNA